MKTFLSCMWARALHHKGALPCGCMGSLCHGAGAVKQLTSGIWLCQSINQPINQSILCPRGQQGANRQSNRTVNTQSNLNSFCVEFASAFSRNSIRTGWENVWWSAEAVEQLTSGIWQSFTAGAGKRVWMSEYASGNYDVTDIRTGLDLSTQVCACMQRPLYTSIDADQVTYASVCCKSCLHALACLYIPCLTLSSVTAVST